MNAADYQALVGQLGGTSYADLQKNYPLGNLNRYSALQAWNEAASKLPQDQLLQRISTTNDYGEANALAQALGENMRVAQGYTREIPYATGVDGQSETRYLNNNGQMWAAPKIATNVGGGTQALQFIDPMTGAALGNPFDLNYSDYTGQGWGIDGSTTGSSGAGYRRRGVADTPEDGLSSYAVGMPKEDSLLNLVGTGILGAGAALAGGAALGGIGGGAADTVGSGLSMAGGETAAGAGSGLGIGTATAAQPTLLEQLQSLLTPSPTSVATSGANQLAQAGTGTMTDVTAPTTGNLGSTTFDPSQYESSVNSEFGSPVQSATNPGTTVTAPSPTVSIPGVGDVYGSPEQIWKSIKELLPAAGGASSL